MATQRECQDEWKAEVAKMIACIDKIDKATPAEPPGNTNSPKWWDEMDAIRRSLYNIQRGEASGGARRVMENMMLLPREYDC